MLLDLDTPCGKLICPRFPVTAFAADVVFALGFTSLDISMTIASPFSSNNGGVCLTMYLCIYHRCGNHIMNVVVHTASPITQVDVVEAIISKRQQTQGGTATNKVKGQKLSGMRYGRGRYGCVTLNRRNAAKRMKIVSA